MKPVHAYTRHGLYLAVIDHSRAEMLPSERMGKHPHFRTFRVGRYCLHVGRMASVAYAPSGDIDEGFPWDQGGFGRP